MLMKRSSLHIAILVNTQRSPKSQQAAFLKATTSTTVVAIGYSEQFLHLNFITVRNLFQSATACHQTAPILPLLMINQRAIT
jgi:hypothetical protein